MTNVQYFDEMNLIQSEKDARVQMCDSLSGAVEELINDKDPDNWEKAMRDLLIAWLLFFGYLTTKQADAVRTFINIGYSLVDINKSDWYERTVANSIMDDAANTLRKTISDIESDTADKHSKTRADVISRDATNKYSNIYNRKIALDNGYTRHKWKSMRDNKVRDSHRNVDGQVQPIDKPFEVNGYYMMYPMDDTYGAPLDEICNCRCTEIFMK